MVVYLILYTIPILGLLFTLIHRPARKYFIAAKMISSTAFVAAAIYFGMSSGDSITFFRMLPGFIMCFFGDVILGFYNRMKLKKLFLAGIAVFLLGHICFITYLVMNQPISWKDVLFPVCALGITAFTAVMKELNFGKMKPYIYIYTFFVSFLFSKSIHVVMTDCSIRTICFGIGAGLFLLSDYLILFLYFAKKRLWITHGVNLVTYYYGIFLLAASMSF